LSGAKKAITSAPDMGTFHHNLSEGYGFVRAFVYNPQRKITDSDLSALKSNLHYAIIYDITAADIDKAIEKLATVFGIDTTKLL
ncbi:MAG: hypothetical protein JNL60_14670, partial [Bacteroidia bacterium]|nr:hypothetical protein [Bacteroidia bacterium]